MYMHKTICIWLQTPKTQSNIWSQQWAITQFDENCDTLGQARVKEQGFILIHKKYKSWKEVKSKIAEAFADIQPSQMIY